MLTAEDGQTSIDEVRRGLEQALSGGPGLAVLPAGPPPWRRALTRAVRPAREVDGAVVVATSGSTGAPVGVVLGADAVTFSAQAVSARLGGRGSWVLALPLTHVAGLMVLARGVVGDGAVVGLDGGWSSALSRLPRGRRYAAIVPTQLRRLLVQQPQVLAELDAVLVGGAGVDDVLREQAEAAGVRLVESYGMTETCGGCVHDGRPLPGVQADVDPGGRVRLAGPMLASAYRRPERDEAVTTDGWFTTSDLGRWRDGRLTVLGRADDVVATGGVSVSLSAVDALLAGHPALADVAAVGVPDEEWGTRVVAVAVPAAGQSPTLESLRRFVAARAEPAYLPRQLVLTDDLARPAPGKVNRARLARLVEGR